MFMIRWSKSVVSENLINRFLWLVFAVPDAMRMTNRTADKSGPREKGTCIFYAITEDNNFVAEFIVFGLGTKQAQTSGCHMNMCS